MDFRDLEAYKNSFELAVLIYDVSKSFPKDEKYSLTDQIRRSSRSVSANIAEAYRKRRYPLHFISKLTDSDAENAETLVWLDFALKFKYLDEYQYDLFAKKNLRVGRLIGYMISNPKKFAAY